LLELIEAGVGGALATVVKTSGSTPQRAGARLLLKPDGTCVGTVGGGAIEHEVVEHLRQVMASKVAQVLVRDLGRDLAMCCGGRMEIFLEAIPEVPRLWLCGAGHVARPTAALARSVGFEVHVLDEREELNTLERFPGCELRLQEPSDVLLRSSFAARDWLLIMTHDHQLDERALELALERPFRYIGLVGSRRKVFRIVQRVAARRGKPSLERVYAPVGLDLGAVSPEEIAVSIVAELIALRYGRGAPHLRALADERLEATLEEVAREADSAGARD
jgi:xanthine dehydrogenase accessory factor